MTVVVPCYNYGRFLPDCVETIVEQPGVDVEVLIVDDASTDGSDAVADRLAAAASDRVRVIHHPENKGHIVTYNDGLAEASGDYVVLLSADDMLTPGALARATAVMEEHPSVGFVYGHPVRFSSVPEAARTEPTYWTIWSGWDWLAARFKRGRNCIFSPEVVMRTRVQREIGGYNPALPHAGDLEMWLRAASVADVAYVGGADQAFYRQHESNLHLTEFAGEQIAGRLIDIRQRAEAFELIAATAIKDRPGAGDLLEAAHRAMAAEALIYAIHLRYQGISADSLIGELAENALAMYPRAKRLPAWTVLSAYRALGSGKRRRDPLSIGYELSEWARWRNRTWRWTRVGL